MTDDTTHGSVTSTVANSGWTLVIAGPGGVRTRSLPLAGELVIGRDEACDVVLEHPRVSRRHVRLRVGDRWTVEDLGSRNRASVRGVPLEPGNPVALAPGESFTVPPFSLLVMAEHAASPASGAAIVVDDPAAPNPPAVLVAVARSPVRVLITGETGVGKELLAAAIHRLSRRSGHYVRLNCATFSETLLESELFGHERGAFTGASQAKPGHLEVAEGGTLFLDEVGELPMSLQAKLLRAVESNEILRVGGNQPIPIDVRFIVATNRDLTAEIARGRFRLDLFYRLAGISLTVPPLAARAARIVPLAEELLRAAATAAGVAPPRIGRAAAERLVGHPWPGNVRELRNVVERALVLSLGAAELGPEHILLDPVAPTASAAPSRAPRPPRPSRPTVTTAAPPAAVSDDAATERARILDALDHCAGNQTRAAKLLGMSRATLSVKLTVLGIPRPRS